MRTRFFIFALCTTLAIGGAGCLRARPSVLPRPVERPAAVQPEPKTETTEPRAEEEIVVGYLQLNGGVATVTRDGETENAEEGTEIAAGDTVRVSSGTVLLVYPNSGVSRLEAGSEVVVIAENGGDGSLVAQVRLLAGSIWTRFERVFGSDEHFSVSGGGVVATVRGTAFGVTLEGEEVDVQVSDHAVEVSDETQPRRKTRVQAGQGFRGRRGALRLRKLAERERQRAGFTFSAKRIPLERLRKPEAVHRLRRRARVPEALRADLLRLRELRLESASNTLPLLRDSQ